MPLHITKVAFGVASLDDLSDRIALRAEEGAMVMTTRYLPKRHVEIAGGSLYWILKHQLIARTPIIGFGDAAEGRVAIHLEPVLRLVVPRAKRAHQGWRYLEEADAPRDLGGDAEGADTLPPALMGELSALGLI